jgi:hypothetical protein
VSGLGAVSLSFEGTAGLVMHSSRTVDPFDPLTKKIKAVTSKRKKTEEDQELIARLEWEAGLYIDPELGPYVPAENVERCLRDAGAVTRDGKNVQRGFLIEDDRLPLVYRGPRDVSGLWDGEYKLTKAVRVQAARTLRCRPLFREWSLDFSGRLDESMLDFETFQAIVGRAGAMIGLCDFRPRYGRFEAKVARA